MGSIHHKFDRRECRIQHARDRTNSLFDSKTASEALCGTRICHLGPQLTHKCSNLLDASKPGFSASPEKFQLCLLEDSMNRSIFGILETSTQLS
ncbi:hypothetical protein QUB05_25470 [Microcoleus sp. F10-C6]|uniref:hypothetical protein n=1 Tax=unclassified Microcoleus TaxID=2642155 RepID=UPI002FCF47E1